MDNNILTILMKIDDFNQNAEITLQSICSSSLRNIKLTIIAKPNIHVEVKKFIIENDFLLPINNIDFLENDEKKYQILNNIDTNYISMIRSGDRITSDYYRKMINKIINTQSDMVIGETVTEKDDGFYYSNISPIRINDIEIEQKRIIDFFSLHGNYCKDVYSSYNKIYKKELLLKVNWCLLDNYENIKKIFENCDKIANIHDDYYIFNDSVPLNNFYCEKNKKVDEIYNFSTALPVLLLDEIKKNIIDKNTKIVSFDMFDTLVVRPFLYPTDLFFLLEEYVNIKFKSTDKILFSSIRKEGEKIAREQHQNYQDITLDEIYEEINKIFKVEKSDILDIKKQEIELEKKYCKARNIAKELYDLALFCNKEVICISDMYLPVDIIRSILYKNGYDKIKKIYVSSKYRKGKWTGDLYDEVIKENNTLLSENYVHIGDNWHSDVIKCQQKGWRAFHLPKPSELLQNDNTEIYTGEFFKKIYGAPQDMILKKEALSYFGIRALFGIIANKLFDNPFIYYNKNSDFNSDPKVIGYQLVGPSLFSTAKYLINEISYEKYDNINFVSRDSYLIKIAFDELNNLYKKTIKSNYIYASRMSLLPLFINKKEDFFALEKNIQWPLKTPEYFVRVFYERGLPISEINKFLTLIKNRGFKLNENFKSVEEFYKFLSFFSDKLYDQNFFSTYKNICKDYFDNFFKGKSAIVDIGYSGKVQSLLASNFGYNMTSYYVHINNDLCSYRYRKHKINSKTILSYTPVVTGTIREFLINENGPSCIGYRRENDGIVNPIFERNENSNFTNFLSETIHNNAVNFIKDVCNTFSSDTIFLDMNYFDGNLPLEEFLHFPKKYDTLFLASSFFEDGIGEGDKVSITDYWDNLKSRIKLKEKIVEKIIEKEKKVVEKMDPYDFSWEKSKWKRIIFLLLSNRRLLLKKIRNKLKI